MRGTAALGPAFSAAVAWAVELHGTDLRRITPVPVIAHLLSVSALVLEHGGDEEEAIAGLLHDAVEDKGGRPMLEEIGRRFGARVARIVEGCSDSLAENPEAKRLWRARKEAYLARLPSESDSVLLISAADKLHNLGSLVRDHRCHDESIWDLFKDPEERDSPDAPDPALRAAKRQGQLWYYAAAAEIYRARLPAECGDMVEQMDGLLAELRGEPVP